MKYVEIVSTSNKCVTMPVMRASDNLIAEVKKIITFQNKGVQKAYPYELSQVIVRSFPESRETIIMPPECSGGCLCSAGTEYVFYDKEGKRIGTGVPAHWSNECHGSPRDCSKKEVVPVEGTEYVLKEQWDTINGGRQWEEFVQGDYVAYRKTTNKGRNED